MHFSKLFNKEFKSTRVSACVTAALLVGAVAPIQTASAQGELEEIVVTGIRASLERSEEVKRQSRQIVDAITSEDLGKFPDQNVAESLQRITGVAIDRSRGGEGRFITVRGLGAEFNSLTYNGRKLATENEGREFSFDVVASELISAAEVFKSNDASQPDGSIGGRVNIKTLRPLDSPGFRASGSIGGIYDDLSENTNIKASGVVSTTWNDDRTGIVVSGSFSERDIRTDFAESIGINENFDLNNDGVQDALSSFSSGIGTEERTRIGLTAAFQHEINDVTRFTVDGLYTSFESPSRTDSISFFPSEVDAVNAGEATISDVVVNSANQVVSQTTIAQPGTPFSSIFDLVARETESDTETIQLGFNLEGQFNDRLRYVTDASYSKADGVRDNPLSGAGSGSFFVVSFPGQQFTQTFTGNRVPDILVTTQNTVDNPTQVAIDELTAEGARLHFSRESSFEIEDEILQFSTDLEYDFNDNTVLKFGWNYLTREKSNRVIDNQSTQCGGSVFTCDRSQLFSDNLSPAELGNLISVFDDSSFLSNTNANVPRAFAVANIDVVRTAFDNFGASLGEASPLTATFNPNESNEIEEDILGAYIQADFDGQFGSKPFRASVGLRASYTDLTSEGAVSFLESIAVDNVSGNNNIIVNSNGARVEENDYFELLPSFNISVDLSESVIIRGALSRTLSRPAFSDLSTVFSVSSINAGSEAISSLNPLLDPIISNNFDFSAEYYGDNGLTLTAAVFYKDISDFVFNSNTPTDFTIDNASDAATGAVLPPQTISFLVSSPENGSDAEVTGLELAAQKIWGNGWGIAANLTLTDSDATTQDGLETQLENLSDTTYNLSVFYENEAFSGRVSFNSRSDFLSTTEGEGGFPEFTDDFEQLDFTLSYNLSGLLGRDTGATVFLEGINVTDEEVFNFSQTEQQLETFVVNGARYVFGVRGAF